MNKGTLIVCVVIILAACGYFLFIKKNDSDISGVDKTWWSDPSKDDERPLATATEHYKRPEPKYIDRNATVSLYNTDPEPRDHYQDMKELKVRHKDDYKVMSQELAEMRAKYNAASPEERDAMKDEVQKKINKLNSMKEQDEFIDLIMGQ